MLVISAARSAVPESGHRLVSVMTVVLLALGVITMHATSGGTTPHDAVMSVAASSQHLSGAVVDAVGNHPPGALSLYALGISRT